MWAGRTAGNTSAMADDFNSSIHIDSCMYREDIKGSMAHSAMLAEVGILTADEADADGFINLFGLPIKVQAMVDGK